MLNIYRASAGSGKTFQLTKDYIFMLFEELKRHHRPHRRILAVTFTNKATDEMKSRILKELHKLSTGKKSDYRDDLMKEFNLSVSDVNSRAKFILTNILHDYTFFSISTIDKFFQQIIRSFAREIGINGGYNVELDKELTLQQALESLYSDLSVKGDPFLLKWMTDFLKDQIQNGKSRYIDRDILKLGQELFNENYQEKAEALREKLHDKDFLLNYKKKLHNIITDFKEEVSSIAKETKEFLDTNGICPKFFVRDMMTKTLDKLQNEQYELGSTFKKYAEGAEQCYGKRPTPETKSTIDAAYNNGLKERLDKIIDWTENKIIPYNTAKIILNNFSTLGILTDLAYYIRNLKNEQNIMLISDTNMLLNKIIDGSETPFVYERTGVNVNHYMIDEFQDTSNLQWKNFKPLIFNSLDDGNKNMLVGDVKQSIYRWRNSDWKLLDHKIDESLENKAYQKKTLDTNWRSDSNIILFNNALFQKAAETLQNELNSKIGENPSFENLKNNITKAYGDVSQKVSKNASVGHVHLQFIEKEGTKADWENAVLETIPGLLEDLVLTRGFKPNDIAFLVRNKSHATTLSTYLMNYKNSSSASSNISYEIVGNEGIKINSSASINFIISVLRLIFNPLDDISRMTMLYEYQAGKNKKIKDKTLKNHFRENDILSARSSIFSEEENTCIDEISRLSLFEATENLISTFKIETWHQEAVYLQAFQDLIFKFVNSSNADLNSFLHWWDENGDNQYIDVPENENAFRVMTIHKSKGLDFKVVIVPFCNWKLEASNFTAPILWCETDVTPFSELSLMPVKFGATLKKTIFQKDYFDELMHQYVDNLNLAYVAFTRARNEIYCFCEKPKLNKSGNISLTSISDLLYISLTNKAELADKWNKELTILKLGEPTNAIYKDNIAEGEIKKLTAYPIADSSNRLKIRHTSSDYWKTTPISKSRVNYGTLMHEILQKTIRKGDESKALNEQYSAGKITEDDLTNIQVELSKFWENKEVNNWFSEDSEVLNECNILLPDGQMYRPDRVTLKDKKATVIDYKFGEEEHPADKKQLNQYIELLKKMDYAEVNGYLYYASLGRVIKL